MRNFGDLRLNSPKLDLQRGLQMFADVADHYQYLTLPESKKELKDEVCRDGITFIAYRCFRIKAALREIHSFTFSLHKATGLTPPRLRKT